MVNRRTFLSGLVCGVLAASPADGRAQDASRRPRIGFLLTVPRSSLTDRLDAFEQGLRELGYVDGQNITVLYRSAEGRNERLAALAAELVAENVDVIVTTGQPAPDVARQATRSIPIVFAVVGDPVEEGLVASFDRPGGNITGLASHGFDVVGKQLELLRDVVPRLSRVGVVRDPAHRGHLRGVREAEAAASLLGLRLVAVDLGSAAGVEAAFLRMTAERIEGAVVLRGGLFVHLRARIVDAALKAKLPAVFGHPEEAEAGGLMAYGTNVPALYRRAATYAVKILRGADPAVLPVEQPTKYDLVVNLRTARALGLSIPPSLLLRADRVIE